MSSTPDRYCEEKVAASGSSFYYSFRLLPADRRQAITALYAFCREVDDVADECADPGVAQAKLAWWQAEIERTFAGGATHPVGRALATAAGRFDLPREQFEEILAGMAMDLTQSRYPDFKSLRLYCHRVAGVVGELTASILGYRNHQTTKYAATLGLALQLMNIIRDVGEDGRRGRIYLPLDELAAHGVGVQDIVSRRATGAFLALMQFQYDRAVATYDEALRLLPGEDRRAQRAGLAMGAIYRALLEEIRHDGFRVLEHRVALTPIRKLLIAWRHWVFA